MDLYLDTADVTQWDALMPLGIFKGITTNPLLAHRAGLTYGDIDWHALAQRAAALGALELHGQVYGAPETFAPWAERLMQAGAAAGLRTVVKVPLTEAGIAAVPQLKALGCPILMTACYHPKQMLVARALGAAYVAPYFGRMAEAGLPAMEMMAQMAGIAALPSAHGGPTPRILAASLRSAQQIVDLAQVGIGCFTIAPEVARSLLDDPQTEAAVAAFEQAAGAAG